MIMSVFTWAYSKYFSRTGSADILSIIETFKMEVTVELKLDQHLIIWCETTKF